MDPGVDNLVATCPTQEEITAVQAAYEAEPTIERFAKPEQYVLKVGVFPKLHERLKNW